MDKLKVVKQYLVEKDAVIFQRNVNIKLLNQLDRLAYVTKNQKQSDSIKQIVKLPKLSYIEKQYYLSLLGKDQVEFDIGKLKSLSDFDKTLFSLASLENKANDELVQNYLSGLLIYLARNYKIEFASLVATTIYEKFGKLSLLDNYTEFLFLNMQENGAIGVLNPLNKNTFSEVDFQKWQYTNTAFSYIYLEKVI